MKRRFFVVLTALAVLIGGCAAPSTPIPSPPQSPTEWRGVWVSYLELDSLLRGVDAVTAAARLDTVMDTCRARGMNTVIFHVRAHSDAYYPSAIYPPADAVEALLCEGFDPLGYAIEAAHARGLTLHAWINPYRIGNTADNAVSDDAFLYDGIYYYNPAADSVRRAVLDGIRELLAYDVDGVHFDDYFYPTGLGENAATFESVPEGMTAADWRRTQVDALVSAVSGLTRRAGKAFGISPVGLPQKARDEHYADVARWMATAGYIDYICPQIYYGFEHEQHPFDATLATWAAMPRADSVALYIGLALYKGGLADDTYAGGGRQEWARRDDIIARQVTAVRTVADGFALFRYAHLAADSDEVNYLISIL